MIHIIIALAVIVSLYFGAAHAKDPWDCQYSSYLCGAIQGKNRITITEPDSRRAIFEIYDPGPGRRLQIRSGRFMDNRILGYIEKGTGRITDTVRRPVGRIEGLFPGQ